MKKRIVHLTSVHRRYDTRIFIKQCQSLAKNDYSVTLVVADGKGNECRNGVSIVDVGYLSGRLNRMHKTVQKIFSKALEIDAYVYQLHDPELLPIGLKLRRLGKKVVFDSHEDAPKQLLDKHYLGPIRLRVLAALLALYERYSCQRLAGIISATPSIRDKFLTINPNTIDVNNFPILDELSVNVSGENDRKNVCYVGTIGKNRGIREMVTALSELQSSVRLNLGGVFSDVGVEAEVKALPGWQQVNEMGFLDRQGVREVLGHSAVGLVTLHPLENYLEGLPVKMFEYMSAGMPVIASDFPLWREIIVGNDCGLCVDPLDSSALARAIDYLMSNTEHARRMGRNGRKAVMSCYNWRIEEIKLLSFYADLTA